MTNAQGEPTEASAEQTSAEQTVTEIWVYGGQRFDRSDGKLWHVWLTRADSTALSHFSKFGKDAVIGGEHEVDVVTYADGRRAAQGPPRYLSIKDQAQRTELYAAHTAHKALYAQHRRVAKLVAEDPLDEALAPLIEIAKSMRTRDQRDAFVATVMRRLIGSW